MPYRKKLSLPVPPQFAPVAQLDRATDSDSVGGGGGAGSTLDGCTISCYKALPRNKFCAVQPHE